MKRQVVKYHQESYINPLKVCAGEEVAIERLDETWPFAWVVNGDGRGGWVPQVYLSQAKPGAMARVLNDYDTRELTVPQGEEVNGGEEVGGWIWCVNREGEQGWVPSANLGPAE